MVRLLSRRPHTVCSLWNQEWNQEVEICTRHVRGATRVSSRTDPGSPIHGGSSTAELQRRLSGCVGDVASWMRANRLQFNAAKTDLLWCSAARHQHQIPDKSIAVGTATVTPVRSVRDLGIFIDSDVSMRTHVARTVSGCFTVLR